MSRVLLLCSTPEVTGPAELMLDDARVLRGAGHEVTVGFDTVRTGTMAGRVKELGLPVAPLALCRRSGPLAIARDVLALRRAVSRGEHEVLHARFSHDHHVALAAAAGRARVVRSCELLSSVAPGLSRRLAFARTHRFAVPSSEHAAALQAAHGIERERVFLLPPRVDAERFTPGPSRLRTELGIPEDAPLAGMVARIKPDRLQSRLLRAFLAVRREVPEARLVFVGRGEGEAALREEVDRLAPPRSVLLAGYRSGEALVDAYRALDVKVWLAPGNDGTNRAVLEAMACGAAILGGRFGSVSEIVEDGRTGRLCDPGAPDDLEGTLAFLLGDRVRARSLGEAGRARAAGVYTPARRAAAVLALVAGG